MNRGPTGAPRVLVYLPNWVGDAVMATSSLRRLRQALPDSEIVGLARPPIDHAAAGLDSLDRIVPHDSKRTNSPHRGWRLVAELRKQKFDAAVLLTNSLRTAAHAWLVGARRRIGLNCDGRGWLLTDRIPAPRRKIPHPVMDDYWEIVDWAIVALHGRLQRLESSAAHHLEAAVLPGDREAWDRFHSKQTPAFRQRPIVAINTGGAFGPAKNWPGDRFAELATRVADRLNVSVVVLCGPAERDAARGIVASANHPFVAGLHDEPLSIGLTKAAVQASSVMATTDSGPRHFAAAFQVPVVTLFGPTHPAWSENGFNPSERLQVPVDCGPCQQKSCPLGHHRCMQDLSVEMVFHSVVRLMDRRRAAA